MIAAFETEDLTDPEVNADPYGYFGRLRESDPVHWNPLFKQWIVTRHSDVVWLIRQHELFSSDMRVLDEPHELQPPVDEVDWELVEHLRETFRALLHYDRPEHLAMRQVVHHWFTPRAVERWRAEVRATARDVIEARRLDGRMEVKADLAMRLPLVTISWMLNVPQSDAVRLHDLTSALMNPGFGPDRMRRMAPAWNEFRDYFSPLIDARQSKEPGEDLIAMLADGQRRGVLTHDQCLANVVLLLVAGHATTMNLICNGLLAFIRNPAQWDLLKSDPLGLARSATEECLRYEPSVKGFFRICTKDLELGDKAIRAGDKLFWAIASANRDPRVFADPDSFDITRSPNPHAAFGGGIHHCLGAALARVEGQEAFRALAELLPRLHLQEDTVEYVPSIGDREVCALPVCWS